MVKLITPLRRKPGMSREEFVRYWREVHAPMVAELQGLRRYSINPAVLIPGASREPAFDGVAELWFDSVEAARAAFASPQGQASQADNANFLDTQQMPFIYAEEISIVQ